jgi:hypothetical protein
MIFDRNRRATALCSHAMTSVVTFGHCTQGCFLHMLCRAFSRAVTVGSTMRVLFAAAVASAALTFGMGAASAADLPARTAVQYVQPYNWTGFYAGLNVGGIWATNSDGDHGDINFGYRIN